MARRSLGLDFGAQLTAALVLWTHVLYLGGCAAPASSNDLGAGNPADVLSLDGKGDSASDGDTGPVAIRPEGILAGQSLVADALMSGAITTWDDPVLKQTLQRTFDALQASADGSLSPTDDALVRSEVYPKGRSMWRGFVAGRTFDDSCPGAVDLEGPLTAHAIRASLLANEAYDAEALPATFDARAEWNHSMVEGTSELSRQLQQGTCSETELAHGLAFESSLQALLNWLELSVLLGFSGDVDKLQADPARYVDEVVMVRLPANIDSGMRLSLQTVVTRAAVKLAQRVDRQVMDQLRTATYEQAQMMAQLVSFTVYSAEGARTQEACLEALDQAAGANVLLRTPTFRKLACGEGDTFIDAITGTTALPLYWEGSVYGELGSSVAAYMTKVTDAYAQALAGDTWNGIYYLIRHNPAGVGAALVDSPSCSALLCASIARAESEHEWAVFWEDVILWGTFAVSVVAIVATGGAALAGYLGAAAIGTTLAAVGTVAATVATVASLSGAIVLGYRGMNQLAEVKNELAAVAFSGGNRAELEAEYNRATWLVIGALIDGALGIADVAIIARTLRASLVAGEASTFFSKLRNVMSYAAGTRRTVVETANGWHQIIPLEDARFVALVGDAPFETVDDVRRLVADSMNPESALFLRMQQVLGEGGVDAPNIWKLYFERAYGNVLLDSGPYQDLVTRAVSAMPQGTAAAPARILDAGSGPGYFSVSLANSGRVVTSVDSSADALDTAARLMRTVHGEDALRHTQQLTDLASMPAHLRDFDGIVMNNVLYTQPNAAATLADLFDRLRPGGVLYLNDPTLEGAARIGSLVEELAVTTFENGGRATRADVAIVGAVNSGRLTRAAGGARPTFYSPEQLRQLVRTAGFEIVDDTAAYADCTRQLILRRPGG